MPVSTRDRHRVFPRNAQSDVYNCRHYHDRRTYYHRQSDTIMAILSFALTTEELLNRQKTVTRRDWKASYMENWQRWYDEGRRLHDAYDQIPIAGGEKIGEIRLTERPYWEPLREMPAEDLEAEGGMVDTKEAFYELVGVPPGQEVAVIRFTLAKVV